MKMIILERVTKYFALDIYRIFILEFIVILFLFHLKILFNSLFVFVSIKFVIAISVYNYFI